jgi:hypothetical protein
LQKHRCFASAFLALTTPKHLQGRIFSLEQGAYMFGEAASTAVGGLLSKLGIEFLATSFKGYLFSATFFLAVASLVNLSLFCSLYIYYSRN